MTNINDVIRRALIKFPLLGHCAANLEMEEKASVQTACTDGEHLYYSQDFLDSLTSDEQVFLVAHEMCHVVLNHIDRSKDKDRKLWNIATDAVINACLEHEGLPIIQGGINIPEAINLDAEEMYERLLKQKNQEQEQGKEQKQGGGQEQGQGQQNNDTSSQQADSENARENMQEKDSQGTEKNDAMQETDRIDISNVGQCHASHEIWEKAVEKEEHVSENSEGIGEQEPSCKSEKDFFSQNRNEKIRKLDEMKKRLIEESVSHGAGKGRGGSLEVDPLGDENGIIDWRQLLKSTLKGQVFDWRLGREARYGVIPYKLVSQPQPVTEILLDTSGSISQRLLRNFLTECVSLLKTSKVKVGCFDTMFYGFHEIRNKKDIERMEFEGGGGTDFDVAVNAFSSSAENKIIFTDGEANNPKKRCDAIWIVFNNGGWSYNRGLNPPGGKVIKMSEEQYNKLFLSTDSVEREE